jgi:hypothetical protein
MIKDDCRNKKQILEMFFDGAQTIISETTAWS